jgi:phenylalanyl-tRNA synthetase beta chain
MKISFNWLKEFVDLRWSPEEAARRLEELGLEVSSISRTGGDVTGVIVARILEVAPHPNADRLSVCRVTDGKSALTIVCGAKNVAAGQRVPLALPGAKLAGGQIIEKSVIRGTESSGMLCSSRELGLSEDHSGILILDGNGKLGRSIEEVFPLKDVILEVEITPNRADCLSHVGIARELAAVSGKRLKPLHLYPLPQGGRGQGEGGRFPIQIENPSDCPRYIGTVVKGVSIRPSPAWLARRLSLCGIRPINNVVDITNYVLLELGHPLHAFDLAKLQGRRIIIRRAGTGENLAALDDKIYGLSIETLVIADEKNPLAIAGIIGGKPSSIQNETQDILLESACFDRRLIRRVSKSLGVRTESSTRFERGAHPLAAEAASRRALELILAMAGGKQGSRTDTTPRKQKPINVSLRPARVNSILNLKLKPQEIKARLQTLGFSCKTGKKASLVCQVPYWRLDVEGEHDLIEEVARLVGYDKIPARLPSPPPLSLKGEDRVRGKKMCAARQVLLSHGFWEGCSSSFVSGKILRQIDPRLLETAVAIENPLSEDQEYLRPSLSFGLLLAVKKNRSQGTNALKMFEGGSCFERADVSGGKPIESKHLAVLIAGDAHAKDWREKPATLDFFEIKSWCELLLEAWGLAGTYSPSPVSFLHPGASAEISVSGAVIGWAGLLHPGAAKALDIPPETVLAEFDLSRITLKEEAARFTRLPKYPPVKRDLSIVVKNNVAWGQIETCVKEVLGQVLEKTRPFDVFSGGNLAPDEKSLAFSLSLRRPDKTLTDAEADELIRKTVGTLQGQLAARLR